ncbi:sugar transporter [Psychromonas sp. RZ22]|uniref:polysaccharide export protein n=1 Tax=Psychromonas algarum TaxID=2555643 RepID=UPI0010672F3C|nr:polysaccharide export protein [Psychromonas sp. RZ22]TEW55759.1 sugar transporter [Psychromonas sp. RZ22]
MLYKSKVVLVFSFIILLTGCTIPGSHLSDSDKNVIAERNVDDMSDQEKQQTPVEQVNVYPLTHSFVAAYLVQNNNASGTARINPNLDKALLGYEYFVGPGDILNITIWDHPELTIPAGSYRSAAESGTWVHADGKIFYPYIGFVRVADQTVVKIRSDISKRLEKYIESPQVDVNIAAFRSQKAYVTGEVKQAGQQPITNVPLTLLDAVNHAGGLTADADWRNVTLTRNGNTETISLYQLMQIGDLTQNRLIQPGDIIHVPRNDSQKVFVLGDVKQPEMLKIDRAGMSLTEALSSVGGINELSADATGIFVVRSAERDQKNEEFLKMVRDRSANPDQPPEENERPEKIVANIYQLNIKDASGLVIGTDFKLEPYDVVYVTAAPIERYNRVIRQLLPTITAFNSLSEGAVRVHTW